MPGSGYGHCPHGMNLQNLRALGAPGAPPGGNTTTLLPGGLRTEHCWHKEVEQTRREHEHRGQLSSRQRASNEQLQATAEAQLSEGIGRVEAALTARVQQLQQQAGALAASLTGVTSELAGLARAQQRIGCMEVHLSGKLTVNRNRQQARLDRPVRELCCDEVSRGLARQEVLLGGLISKLQRVSSLVAHGADRLASCKQRLASSLRDKLDAVKVDEAVLRMSSSAGAAGALSSLGSKARAFWPAASGSGGGSLHSCTHDKQTSQLTSEAGALAADAGRLRKAAKQVLQECLTASQAAARTLDAALAAKLQSTQGLRGELAAQLQEVGEQMQEARQQRDGLQQTLANKQVPLQQLAARLALRSSRPAAEAVSDDVERAMAAEAAQLQDLAGQLRVRAEGAGQQIAQLQHVSAALLQHIADKEAALSVEEKVAKMDGRAVAAVPCSPTVLSVASSVVSGYSHLGDSVSQVSCAPASRLSKARRGSRPQAPAAAAASPPGRAASSCVGSAASSAAVKRIADLERELAAARSETAQLQRAMGMQAQAQEVVAEQAGSVTTTRCSGSKAAAASMV